MADPYSILGVARGASEAEINRFITDLSSGAELLEVVRSGALGISRLGRNLRVVR